MRDFKGIWIPKEIWLNKKLSLQEKVFLAEIDSLDNENGCFASNGHFADFFGLSKNRCSEVIKSLETKGLVKSDLIRNGKHIEKRVLRLTYSKSRLPYSESRQGYSESRQGYSRNSEGINTINNTKERESRALDFLKLNFPSRFEIFLQQNKSQIKDFKKFEMDFNDTCDQEQLEYNDRVLFGRLGKYSRNWVENQNRYKEKEEDNAGPTYLRKIL